MKSRRVTQQVIVNLLTLICCVMAGFIANLWSVSGAEFPTLLWAPAGIALAAVLLYGFTVLPSIGIGSFLLTLILLSSWRSDHRHKRNSRSFESSGKKELIDHLYKIGAFTGKNAAKYIAQVIKVSRATVYNYLSKYDHMER